MRLAIAVDPDLTTHRSYGVPQVEPTPELMEGMASIRINPTGELPEPLPFEQAASELARLDGYQWTETDQRENERQGALLTGQFLIDRFGVIRWANLECAGEGLSGIGKFPTLEELLAAGQIAS